MTINGKSQIGVRRGIPVPENLRNTLVLWKVKHGLSNRDIAAICNVSQTCLGGIMTGRVISCHVLTIKAIETMIEELP